VVTVTFPPSKNFEAYLMQFIKDHFNHNNQIDILSKHVHNRLVKICKRGPRGKVLTLSEIERARVSLKFKIYIIYIKKIYLCF
jgi:hypothetical protein